MTTDLRPGAARCFGPISARLLRAIAAMLLTVAVSCAAPPEGDVSGPDDVASTVDAIADTGTAVDAEKSTEDGQLAGDSGADTSAADASAADAASPDGSAADGSGDSVVQPPDGKCQSSADCAQASEGCQANVCIAGVCTPQVVADGTPCNDGDLCTAKAACAAGVCAVTATLDCATNQPCLAGACDAKTGKCSTTAKSVETACDDGDSCTNGTVCDAAGACSGGVNACGCTSIKDCATFDDGDPCNGTLFCNEELAKPTCEVLAASVVVCDTSTDGPCKTTVCSPTTGACEQHPNNDGAGCDDDNACTVGESCSAGVCASFVNTCQCQNSADCLKHDDGNACNGTLYCDLTVAPFACKTNPASVPTCAAAPAQCQITACDPKTGGCKINVAADGSPCDDGNAKTVGDACKAGTCEAGTSIAQCSTNSDCAKHEDGNFCNGVLFCNKAVGKCHVNPATLVSCPSVDDTDCEKNLCKPATGLCTPTPIPDGLGCDDNNACTVGEVCAAGACKPSADVCQCQSDSDCAGKDDGDLCNGVLFCNVANHTCELNKSTIVTCPTVANSACTTASCDPKAGTCSQQPLADASPCTDDDPCTAGDACAAGVCEGTKTCVCTTDSDCAAQDDGNGCNGTLFCNKGTGKCAVNPATIKVCPTVDDTVCAKNECQPKTGKCAPTPAFTGAKCNADGNPCTANDYCDSGVCKAGKSVCGCFLDKDCDGKQGDNKCVLTMVCDQATFTCKPGKQFQCDTSGDSPCRATACDPQTGKCAVADQPNGTVCGESAVCAGAQVCAAGKCVPGVSSDCNDADACTLDTCDPKIGCQYAALDKGDCDDGNVCTSDDSCSKGHCVGTAKDCSDESPCTDDACDPEKGCVYLPSKATVCDDGDLCRQGDFCLQGLCLSGSKSLLCDDGNPCTTDTCDAKQGCVATASNGNKCDDASACTKSDACANGVCQGAALLCDDGSGCTQDSCSTEVGCVHLALAGTPCNDGNACTVGDACIASGLCASGQSRVCDDANPCTVDLCDPLQGCVTKAVVGSKCDDGNACTVNEKCEKAACTGSPRDCDDGLVCSKDTCDADAGCKYAVEKGSKCDDGNACTSGDICVASGSCAPGPGLNCDDGNGCSTDACDPNSGCTHKSLDGIGCNDGNSCTNADKCTGGKCGGVGKSCDDGLSCTQDDCDKVGGCVHLATAGTVCDDGNACTIADVCLGSGYCKPGSARDCDDSNACTNDACLPQTGCTHSAKNGAPCDDGNACSGQDTCSDQTLCTGSPVNCDDGRTCTKDSCDKVGGCQHASTKGATCSDNNACTLGDTCLANGNCASGPAKSCNDGNTCTTDACDPQKGCQYTVTDKAACSDGSQCTQGDSCTGDKCVGSPVTCDDGQTCTKDGCDKLSGCTHKALSTTTCNDGNACTQGDRCSAAGTCSPGGGISCDDGKPCTTDGCDAASGCTHKAIDGVACSDNNACTGPDVCNKGTCAGGTLSCDDNEACTKDSCDTKLGCKYTAQVGQSCSDNNACTAQDKCSTKGVCAGTAGVSCNDNNGCTQDTCDTAAGCKNTALTGKECSDSDFCTTLDTCNQGTCKGTTISCDDKLACTIDSCSKTKGCQHSVTLNAPCNDADACTSPDKCAAEGRCVGATKKCDDTNACTLDTCDSASGCVFTKLQGASCDDGKICTVKDACSAGTCAGTPQNCDDGSPCTTDSCDINAGCQNTPQLGKPCSDGNECTVGDKCGKGNECAGAVKNCSDGNDCTTDSCHKVLGCLYKNAASDSACSDGDGCTNNWCDGTGTCQSKARLWSYTLPTEYLPYDYQVLDNGDVAVVGESSTTSSGAFFLRIANAGKQPSIVPTTSIYRWRKVRARPGGGFMAIGDSAPTDKSAEYALQGQSIVARLDAKGKVVNSYSSLYGNKTTPNVWDALEVGKDYAMVAATRRWQTSSYNTFFFLHRHMTTNSNGYTLKAWKPAGVDHYTRLIVHGIAPLVNDTMLAVVSVTTLNGNFVYNVQVTKSGAVSATEIWSIPYNGGGAGQFGYIRVVHDPAGGFDLIIGKNGRKRRRYTNTAKLFAVYDTPTKYGPVNWGTLRDILIRGNQVVAIDNTADLGIFNRGQQADSSKITLAELPESLRAGPERNLYMLYKPAASPAPQQWRIDRSDPWGGFVCTDCLTLYGKNGCNQGKDRTDACNVGTGTCTNITASAFCNDGNECTTDSYSANKGECVHVAKNGQNCTLGDTLCSTSTVGKCNSLGQCSALPTRKPCSSSLACYRRTCDDSADTSTDSCKYVKRHTGASCGLGKSCASGYCYTDSGIVTKTFPTQTFSLTGKGHQKVLATFYNNGKKLRSARLSLKVYSSAFSFAVYLKTGTEERLILSSAFACSSVSYNACLPKPPESATMVFPDKNRPLVWVDNLVGTDAFSGNWQLLFERTSEGCTGFCPFSQEAKVYASLRVDDY